MLLGERLRSLHSSGSDLLSKELALWGMDRAAVVDELVLLATSPPAAQPEAPKQWVDAVVGKEQTPLLYEKFCKWLFVGFAHNLLLECMVSRLTMLEKRHPHQHALKLNAVFKYHMKQEPGRMARAALRSEMCGARRQAAKEAALEGKLLKKSRGNMRQQLALAGSSVWRSK